MKVARRFLWNAGFVVIDRWHASTTHEDGRIRVRSVEAHLNAAEIIRKPARPLRA